jgi:trans-2-enoyl-CoA reductase
MRRDDFEDLESNLKSLGADHVLTYDEFFKKESRSTIKEWTSDGELRLALNCVGGKETGEMAKLLALDGFLGSLNLRHEEIRGKD